MKPYRGLTKDGKMVKGSLVKIYDRRYIARNPEVSYSDDTTEIYCTIWGFIEVIPATVAQQVGLKDKNEKEGYENDKVSFGSTRPVYLIKWSICNAGFYLESMDEQKEHLGITNFFVGEIIPPEGKEKPK